MDREEFTRAVLEYENTLYRVAKSMLGSEADCADAAQNALLRAWERLHTLRDPAYFKTWLTRIAINTCKNIRRSGWFRYIDHSVPLDRVAGRSAPASQEDDEITTEILNLPIKLREVALLCWLQGTTCDEAAEMLGISRQAVGSRLNRARKKLRFALEGSDVHDPS